MKKLILILALLQSSLSLAAVSTSDKAELGINENYITNGGCEHGTAGWKTYADAAASSPVDGIGGSPSVTITSSSTGAIEGSRICVLTKDAVNRQGQGWSYDFTVKRQAQMLNVSFDYFVASGTYDVGSDSTDSDITAWVYGPTDGTPVLTQLAPYKVIGATTGTQLKFSGRFQTAASGTAYRLILHEAKTGTSAYTVKVDGLKVSPDQKSIGAPVTDWQSYVPTLTGFGTPSGVSFRSRRVGGNLEVEGKFTSGTSTATQAQISLGYLGGNSNVVVDSSTAAFQIVGFAARAASGTDQNYILANAGNSYLQVSVQGASLGGLTAANGNDFIASGITFEFKASVAIQGWGSSVVMSNDSDTRVVAARYHVSANYAYTSPNPINFDALDFDTHGAVTTGASTWKFTAPVPGYYRLETMVNSTGAIGGYMSIFKNGSQYADLSFQFSGDTIWAGSTLVKLNAGDYINLVLPSNCTLGVSAFDTWVSISRQSGPAQIAASETVSAKYYQTTGQTFTSSTTQINFDTKVWDSHGMCTVGASFNCVAPVAGKYKACWKATSGNTAWTQGQGMLSFVYKNGAQAPGNPQDTQIAQASGTYRLTTSGCDTLDLIAGDSFDIRANTSVSSTALAPAGVWFTVEKVGN